MINFYRTQVLSLPGLTNFCSTDLIIALVTAGRLLYSNSIFPCYLGMEINAKTRWTITKIVELGKKSKTANFAYGSINLKKMSLLYTWKRTTQRWSKKIRKFKKKFFGQLAPHNSNVCLISGWEKGQDRKIWCQRNRRWGEGDLIDSIEGTLKRYLKEYKTIENSFGGVGPLGAGIAWKCVQLKRAKCRNVSYGNSRDKI